MSTVGRVEASIRTDPGRVRDHNEDYVAYHEPAGPDDEARHGWLYLVADGVGGAEAGEIASQYACERTLAHYLNGEPPQSWARRLQAAMEAANSDLRRLATTAENGRRMATTMVAAVLHDGQASIANVGDSRAYVLRDGRLWQITRDQSLVAQLVEEGSISPEDAANHPRKHIILHSLGSETSPRIDTFELPLRPGEAIVLCSDGLVRHVNDEEIAAIVADSRPDAATGDLIQLANDRGGEDNISVAVLRIGEQPAREMKPNVSAAAPAAIEDIGAHNGLWVYTAVLCLVQTVLMTVMWLLLRG
jgi:protein phosphatase